MFNKIILTTVLTAVAAVYADPVPSVPGPSDVYNEGASCSIEWAVDTTGTWKTMNIELMTGANLDMKHLTTVTTIDGTDPTKTPFTWDCPAVTPNAAIYFYQFTSPDSANVTWTTRFAIADTTGNTVAPEQSAQPDGSPIPWGSGALVDPSTATPPPTKSGSTSSNSTGSPPAGAPSSVSGSSSSAAHLSSSSSSSSSAASKSTPSPSPQNGATTPNSTAGAAAANGAVGFADSKLLQAAVSLAAVAAAFAVAL